MIPTNPNEVQGAWSRGWTLDWHITSSTFLGYDENGHPRFDSTRSPLGELLYRLKYRGQNTVDQVANVMAGFFDNKPNGLSKIDLVVPVPPSTPRKVQPVVQIATAIAKNLGKAVSANAVRKTKETPGLKNIHDVEQRRELLEGAFEIDADQVKGKGILLIDDLYRSGATANAVTVALLAGGAARVYFLAATRTRSST
jgi:predicted amidophosphoribosyltransferase